MWYMLLSRFYSTSYMPISRCCKLLYISKCYKLLHPLVRFTIMCYNILSDRYATRQVYGYCPSWALGWEYRKGQLLKEIVENMADLVALQEVETEQFYNFFHPELSQHGYDGIFQPKSRARTMDEHERKYVDGCAIFYHKSK